MAKLLGGGSIIFLLAEGTFLLQQDGCSRLTVLAGRMHGSILYSELLWIPTWQFATRHRFVAWVSSVAR